MSTGNHGEDRPHGDDAAEPATLGAAHAAMVRAFQPVAEQGDPLEVELFASSLVGTWWQALPPPADPDELLGTSTVAYAVGHPAPAALALLRALAAVGPSGVLRHDAGSAADTLSAAGVVDPPWAASIGRVRPGGCWLLSDVYGYQASLCCEFSYDGLARHALLALLEFASPGEPGGAGAPAHGSRPGTGPGPGPGTGGASGAGRGAGAPTPRQPGAAEAVPGSGAPAAGGWVKDVWITVEPDEVLAGMRKQADPQLMTFSVVELARAQHLLTEGLAGTDAIWQPEVLDTFRDHRALAMARCRALAGALS